MNSVSTINRMLIPRPSASASTIIIISAFGLDDNNAINVATSSIKTIFICHIYVRFFLDDEHYHAVHQKQYSNVGQCIACKKLVSRHINCVQRAIENVAFQCFFFKISIWVANCTCLKTHCMF